MSSAELLAGCYEDLVHWYCNLCTRRTVCRRAAGTQPEHNANWVKSYQTM